MCVNTVEGKKGAKMQRNDVKRLSSVHVRSLFSTFRILFAANHPEFVLLHPNWPYFSRVQRIGNALRRTGITVHYAKQSCWKRNWCVLISIAFSVAEECAHTHTHRSCETAI